MRYVFLALVFLLIGACSENTSQKEASDSPESSSPESTLGGKATLIIDFDNGEVEEMFCHTLSAEKLTGLDLLRATKLKLIESSGGLICKIENVGCDKLQCLGCACSTYGDPDCRFWSYWHWIDGEWEFSQVGADDYPIEPGAIEAWKWGNDQLPPVWDAPNRLCRQ